MIPTWATMGVERPDYDKVNTFYEWLMYILFLLKVTRIMRPLRIRRKLQVIEDEVERTMVDMILRILILILFSKYIRCSVCFSCLF